MKKITLYTANCCGNHFNAIYPNVKVVSDAQSLLAAVRLDNVSALYGPIISTGVSGSIGSSASSKASGSTSTTSDRGEGSVAYAYHRSNQNFISSDNICMDCDNTPEDPGEPDIPEENWITPDDVHNALPHVAFYAVPSRNNGIDKKYSSSDGGTNGVIRSARPRYHYVFPLKTTITSPKEYARMKASLHQYLPVFDNGTFDAGRFMYGNKKLKASDIVVFDGDKCIDEVDFSTASALPFSASALPFSTSADISDNPCDGLTGVTDLTALSGLTGLKDDGCLTNDEASADYTALPDVIESGSRNKTLSRYASRLIKKLGITTEAEELYRLASTHCTEPLDESELDSIWNSACKFYRIKVLRSAGYIPPEEYQKLQFVQSLIPHNLTDIGEAELFAAKYNSSLRYSRATNWLVYSGSVWSEDEVAARGFVHRLTEEQIARAREMVLSAQQANNEADETVEAGSTSSPDYKESKAQQKSASKQLDFAKKYRRFVLSEQKTNRVSAVLTEAQEFLQVKTDDLDSDPFILNTPAGEMDLKTGKMHPHNPDHLITKMTTVAPLPESIGDYTVDDFHMAAVWFDFLDQLTSGNEELSSYLQQIAGMFLVGRVYCEYLVIAYGSGGNGKSTFFNLLHHILGDYAGSLSAETLTTSCRKNKSPEFAELRGKRLVIAAELEEGKRLDTAVMKKLCSTDPIYAEKKYRDPFKFEPSHSIVLYTNHLPKVGTTDKGTWDRLIAIPFKASFRGTEEEILNYAQELYDACAPAVLTWMIEGAKLFISNRFKIALPDIVQSAIDAYRADNDWVKNFLDECCETSLPGVLHDPEFTMMSGDLVTTYRDYCMRNGEYTRSVPDFRKGLMDRGVIFHHGKKGTSVYGLKLKDPYEGRDGLAALA